MNSSAPDHDLHAMFAAQKGVDRDAAPAWNPGRLKVAPQGEGGIVHAKKLWLPLLASAVGCVAVAMWVHQPVVPAKPSLVEALPVLFPSSTSSPSLLAGVNTSGKDPLADWSSGTDFLLPARLTIDMP